MRAFKIFQSLCLIVITGHLLTITSTASAEGALQKTSPPSERISSVLTLPFGILAGEFDRRPWDNPYNGLYLSRDLGETWATLGLEGRGITDASYSEGLLGISTYYYVNDQVGLFISTDQGNTFTHAGLNFSASKVEVEHSTIYLGGYSHGLWVSHDSGSNWEQKIGYGTDWSGPTITAIEAKDNLAFTSSTTNVYRSVDAGLNWQEIPVLAGEQIHTFYIGEQAVLAGANNNEGMFISYDQGMTWNKISNWGNYPTGKITGFKNTLYTQKIKNEGSGIPLLKSEDGGITWQETGVFSNRRGLSMDSLFSYPSYLFISVDIEGIYRYGIPAQTLPSENFFTLPWISENPQELTTKITAFFDHQYPLTGYSHYPEPTPFQTSTINYLGFTESTKNLPYSSHNGTDFALPLYTEILAAAPGLARYYTCSQCGHSIKIDHNNGYQSVYMHLDKNNLISKNPSETYWVEQGEAIGKVGMSGKTSGPHLHFQVLHGQYPDGLVDPFSWLDPYNPDPWEHFAWNDALGAHQGSASPYLWEHSIPIYTQYINQTQPDMVLGNKSITFNLNDPNHSLFTAMVVNYIKPKLPFSQFNLKYIEGTSLSISASDHYEKGIAALDGELTITVDLTDLDFQGVLIDTLVMYTWDSVKQKWEPLPTIIDHVNNRLTARTDHLSYFAVLGEKIYPHAPTTSISVTGEYESGWLTAWPEISFMVQDQNNIGIKNTYYSYNKGLDWFEYSGPVTLEQDGVITILYRSEDNAGNLELTNSQVIKIDTLGRWKDQIKVVETSFSTN